MFEIHHGYTVAQQSDRCQGITKLGLHSKLTFMFQNIVLS